MSPGDPSSSRNPGPARDGFIKSPKADGQIDGRAGSRVDGRVDGVDGHGDGHYVDGHADGHYVDGVDGIDGTHADGVDGFGSRVDGVDGQVDGEVDGHQDGEVDGQMDGQVDGEVDGQVDGELPLSEMDRLEQLNIMHDLLLNPQQDHVITGHLARVHATGRRSQVLDVGTGVGTWAINLARRHPYADVIGIDIDWRMFKNTNLPHGNIDFYTVDVTNPLPWPDNTFDLIHVKSMLMDVPQYPGMIRKLARVLRPGGLMILVESELRYQCLEGEASEALDAFSEALKTTLATYGTDVDIAPNLDRPVADTGLFSAQFYFQEIGCPVGSYMAEQSMMALLTIGSANLQDAGRIHRIVLRGSLTALVCPRIPPGPERTHLESLIETCVGALSNPSARYLQRLFAVYAYKKFPRHRHMRYST